MKLIYLFMAMFGLTFALVTSHVYADSVKDDIIVFQQQTGVCPGGIAVDWVHALRVNGERAEAGASAGICEMWFDYDVRSMSKCDTRRIVFHEGGHILGLDDSDHGIMSIDGRNDVALPGCPAIHPSILTRAEDKLLDIVPLEWTVSCGRIGKKVRCTAESPDKRPLMRRYVVRSSGTKIWLHRVKNR